MNLESIMDPDEEVLWSGGPKKQLEKKGFYTSLFIYLGIIVLSLCIMIVPLLIPVEILVSESAKSILVLLGLIGGAILMVIVLIELYFNIKARYFENIKYFLTKKRLIITSDAMKNNRYSKYTDSSLNPKDFTIENNTAFIELNRIKRLIIRKNYNIFINRPYYSVHCIYSIENDQEWRFILHGLENISDLIECITEKLHFRRSEDIKYEIYISK
ncbi:MAG: hypothetical protein GF329_20985 [Candidatus Lokiarchaeota archaeon]|nr:hypothetical protein [Candidatus Lokiarchaeota archaeon]